MNARLLHAPALARRIGVPLGWLRAEADAGRLPHVRAGSRYLFHIELVERELLRRAAGETSKPRPAGERRGGAW